MPFTTVLLDLDGVIRHFDPAHVEGVETKYGLPIGILHSAAFEPGLIQSVVTGRVRRSEWTQEVGRRVGNDTAAAEWMDNLGAVDAAMLTEVNQLRQMGTVVAILTNGTDTIPAEMDSLGLTNRFDRIFNTADIGYAKPDPIAFEYVCDELDVAPASVFFTDDSQSKLHGAVEIGMTARLFEDVPTFRTHLDEFGLSTTGSG